jgi:hypothetical protein
MRRVTWAGALTATFISALSCAGELEGDESAYRWQGPSGPVCGDVPALLAARCGQNFCHGGDQVEAALDLRSPGVEARLVGVNASSEGCTTRQLVAPGAAPESFLLEKITSSEPACGFPMPVVGELSADEVACVQQWVQGLAAGGDAGGPGAGGAVAGDGSAGGGP